MSSVDIISLYNPVFSQGSRHDHLIQILQLIVPPLVMAVRRWWVISCDMEFSQDAFQADGGGGWHWRRLGKNIDLFWFKSTELAPTIQIIVRI